MPDIFQTVKESVDIIEAAERCGISVNGRKKAHCPWHEDKTPSLSFKGQRFTCFSCGAGGDVIELVGRLANKAPLEAVQEINCMFRLGLDLDAPVPLREIRKRERIREEKERFALWEKNAFLVLSAYFRFLRECRTYYAPKRRDEPLHPLFVESLVRLDYIEYLIDAVFICGGTDTKKEFYLSHEKEVRAIGQRLMKERMRYAGRTETGGGTVTPFRPRLVCVGKMSRPAA